MIRLTKHIDLKQIERKAYLSYHQDGLVDICIGFALLIYSIGLLIGVILGSMLIGPIIGSSAYLWVFVYASMKKLVTIPRIGYVKFSPQRHVKIGGAILGLTLLTFIPLAILIVLTILHSTSLLVIPDLGLLLEVNYRIIFGLLGGCGLGLIGFLVEIRRFYGYGAVALTALIFSHFFDITLYLPGFVLGLVLLITGFSLLFQFLRQYPKEEHSDEISTESPKLENDA